MTPVVATTTLGSTTVAVRDGAGGGSLTYLLGHQLGSTTVSVNASGGSPVVQRYLPYGAPRSTTGGNAVTDRGWIGQTKDNSTGLQYLKRPLLRPRHRPVYGGRPSSSATASTPTDTAKLVAEQVTQVPPRWRNL